jgi:hypothetical protein
VVADKEVPRPRRRRIEPASDGNGHHWTIPAEHHRWGSVKTVEFPEVTVWWSREKALKDEWVFVRQADVAAADVLILTLGQVYDLIDVLNQAVETT